MHKTIYKKEILNLLQNEIIDFYENIRNEKVAPCVAPAEIKAFLNEHFDFKKPMELQEVILEVEKMLRKWNLHVTHPRYFGLFCPSVTFASIIADALVALYNPQLASWNHSPIGNEIEQFSLGFFLEKFGFDPENRIAHFTSGGAESNLTATIVALTHKFPGYGKAGLRSLSGQPVFYVSQEAHHSFLKIAHMTGLGRESLRVIKTDNNYTMEIEDLKEKIREDTHKGFIPFMVVGTAGTTSAGMIDPLGEIAELCRKNDLWFHVDAAWGGAAILSDRLGKYLAGIEKSDSITFDAHKWLSVPMGAGMFFCRHIEAVKKSFYSETTYMPGKVKETTDYYSSTIQWSRRFIGLKLFMTLAELGEGGLAEMIEKQGELGKYLSIELQKSGWKIITESPLAVVCFTHEKFGENITLMKQLVDKLYERGRAWISTVILKEKTPAFRACISSYRAEKSDVDVLIKELNVLLSTY